MWDVGDVGYPGCDMLGMCDVGDGAVLDVGRWGGGMFRMWDVGNEECLGCGMLEMWDVGDVGC